MLPLLLISLLPLWTLQPSFSTAERVYRSPAHRSTSLDFGRCGDPGIVYDFGLDGSNVYGYAPENQTQFPHGYSTDIASLEVYTCDRLQADCGASQDAVQACVSAFENYSGLSGQQGADAWNSALGLYGTGPTSYETTTTTVVTTTLLYTSDSAWTSYSSASTISPYPPGASSPTRTITSTDTLVLGSSSSRSGTSEHSLTSPTITSTSTVFLSESTTSSSTTSSLIVPTSGPTTITTTTASLSSADLPSQSSSLPSANTNGSPFSMQSGVGQARNPRIFLLNVFISYFLARQIR